MVPDAQTIRPTPNPAPNIMANQEKVLNSGFSSAFPSLRRPEEGTIATINRNHANSPTARI